MTRQAGRKREHSAFQQVGGIVGATLVLMSALGLLGCGSGDEQTTSTADATRPAEGSSAESGRGAAVQSAARAAGRKACKGRTPLEVARHYEAAAREAGVTKRFAKLATEPTPEVESSSGYPRLAAAIYATTTPVESRAQAAAGCAEELAVDGEDGEATPERAGQTAPPSHGGANQKGSN